MCRTRSAEGSRPTVCLGFEQRSVPSCPRESEVLNQELASNRHNTRSGASKPVQQVKVCATASRRIVSSSNHANFKPTCRGRGCNGDYNGT